MSDIFDKINNGDFGLHGLPKYEAKVDSETELTADELAKLLNSANSSTHEDEIVDLIEETKQYRADTLAQEHYQFCYDLNDAEVQSKFDQDLLELYSDNNPTE
jgi:hypothetical protein